MKKYMIIVLLALPTFLLGQTTTENYIKSTTYLVPTQNGNQNSVQILNKTEGVSYFDGLGRPTQSIAQRAGSNTEDIISIEEYDGFGRSPRQYLPLPISSADGAYRSGSISNEINTYYSSKYPQDVISSGVINAYNEIRYEDTWDSRSLEQGSAGADWRINPSSDTDHTIKNEYGFNTRSSFVGGNTESADDVAIFRVEYVGNDYETPSLIYEGIFEANTLSKRVVKDENWTPSSGSNHTTETFTNDRGQLILKRHYNNGNKLDTYYVYDKYNNLSYVLSPEGTDSIISGTTANITQEKLEQWGYQYIYDYRNRPIKKRVPGKGWEYIVYDKLNRPVLSQDVRMRENNQWLFTKYDVFGRPVYTGLYQSSIGEDFTSIQNAVNAQSNFNELRTSNTNTIGGGSAYYSNSIFPTASITLHSVNYFDNYIDHAGITLPSSVFNQDIITSVKSLPTVSKVRVLETNDWITTVTGYDYKRRPIFGISQNTYLGTEDSSESLLDFLGKVLEGRKVHQKANQPTIITKDYFTYDHQQRLLTQTQQIDDEPLQLILSNTYDEIGQLVSKHIGGQLFESGYTDITAGRIEVSDDGVITKIDGGDTYNAGLATVGKIEGDGGISFVNLTENKRYIIGFNDNNQYTNSTGEIDYAFFFHWTNPGRYRVRIRENNVSTYITGYVNYNANDHFAIEREGDVLSFIQNGSVVATHTMTQNFPSLVGDMVMADEGAQISNLNLYATNISKSLQKVDYAYNIRGWMTDINDVDSQSRDTKLFNFRINYNGAIEGSSASQGVTPLYNGNISQTTWKTLSADPDQDKRSYGYQYDALNRLTNAYSYKGSGLSQLDKYGLEGVSYDKNGNINNLLRYGYTANTTEVMDQLVYSYLGNQLQNVTDLSTHSIKNEGFYDGNTTQNDDYEYDVNGNMIVDRNKGISNISYNHLNLPVTVSINTSADPQGIPQQGTITYVYDATGAKLEKQVSKQSQPITYTRYAGAYIYEEENGTESLKMFAHPEGYVEPVAGTSKSVGRFNSLSGTSYSSYLYAFNYTDHLGNVRFTYADSDGDGAIEQRSEVISEKHYYPFGLKHQGYNNTVTSNANSMAEKFAFGGNELGEELGLDWYDISARNYDSALARWMNIDPLADQMRRHSPYNYAFDNPIFYIDPDGLSPTGTLFSGGKLSGSDVQNSAFGNQSVGVSLGVEKTKSGAGGSVTVNGNSTTTTSSDSESSTSTTSSGSMSSSTTSTEGGDNWFSRMAKLLEKEINTGNSALDFVFEAREVLITLGVSLDSSKGSEYAITASKIILGFVSSEMSFAEFFVRNEKWGYWYSFNQRKFFTDDLIRQRKDGSWVSGSKTEGLRNSRNTAKYHSKLFKKWGKRFFYIGATVSAVEGINHLGNGNYKGAGRSALDIGMARVSMFGPMGASISIFYFGGSFLYDDAQRAIIENYGGDSKRFWKEINDVLRATTDNSGSLCFVKGTKISMSDGSFKNIENIKIGDVVKTYNENTHKIENNEVLKLDSPFHKNLIKIDFENTISNTNTQDHPYYVKNKGWSSFRPDQTKNRYGFNVKQLKIGDVCYLLDENMEMKEIKIINIIFTNRAEKTYNLTEINNNHNFFANGILVHNKKQ